MNLSLIPTLDILQEFVPVTKAFTLSRLTPFVNRATKNHIITALGKPIWEAFLAKYQGTNPLTNEEEELLYFIRTVQANAGLLLSLPSISVRLSDAGIMKVEGESETQAYKYQVTDLRKNLANAAEEGISDIYTVLENNADAFPDWAASEAATIFQGEFINRIEQVEQFYSINFNRILFRRLRPIFKREQEKMKGLLTDTVYQQLINGLPDLQNEFLQLYNRAKPVIIFRAMAEFAATGNLNMDETGIKFTYMHEDSSTENSEKPDPALLDMLRNSLIRISNVYLSQLRTYLTQNATALGYVVPVETTATQEDKKTFWL